MRLLMIVSSAWCWNLYRRLAPGLGLAPERAFDCERFVGGQVRNLPAWLKPVFIGLAALVNIVSLFRAGGWFGRLSADRRDVVIDFWLALPGPGREFARFFDTLTTFYLFSLLGEGSNERTPRL